MTRPSGSSSTLATAQLDGDRGDPIALLVADVGHVADSRDTVGEQGDHRQGHHGIGQSVHVHIDGRGPAGDGRAVRLARTEQPMYSRMSTNARSP